jgi:hypothetical protein
MVRSWGKAWPVRRREPVSRRDANHESAADELRADLERELFELYETRRLSVETQATAVTAAALTVGGLLVLGQDELRHLGAAVEWGIPIVLLGLVWAIVCASVARFASWSTPHWRGGPKGERDQSVAASLEAWRNADDDAELRELAVLAHAHWSARALSAYELGDFKFRRLRLGLWGLALAGAYLVLVAGALVVRAADAQNAHAPTRGNTGATQQPKAPANRYAGATPPEAL